MTSVGRRIKSVRETLGISQVEFAKKMGVSKQTLYKYENDIIINIPSDKIEIAAKIAHVSPAYLMGWVNDDPDSISVYYDNTLCDIAILLENAGYIVTQANHSDEPYIVIESPDHKTLIAIYEGDLVTLHEKLTMDHIKITAATILEHIQRNLTPDEAELLLNYQKLNDLGKDRAREDVADLTEIPKYIADYPDTMAAHFDGEEMTDQQKAAIAKLRDIVKQQEK